MRLSVSFLLLWVFATGNIDGSNLFRLAIRWARPHFPLVKVRVTWLDCGHALQLLQMPMRKVQSLVGVITTDTFPSHKKGGNWKHRLLPLPVGYIIIEFQPLKTALCKALKTVNISNYIADFMSNALKLVYIGNQIGNMKSHISNQACYKLVITQLLIPIYHIWHSQLCSN